MLYLTDNERRELIWKAIKIISDRAGGDDEAFLKEYYEEVVEKYKDDLDIALECFLDLYENVPCRTINEPPLRVKEKGEIIDFKKNHTNHTP